MFFPAFGDFQSEASLRDIGNLSILLGGTHMEDTKLRLDTEPVFSPPTFKLLRKLNPTLSVATLTTQES